jgi:toxin ParE1/3/4
MKPLHWHPLARRDADEAAAWYAEQGGLALELAFTDSLEAATGQIARHPGIGSTRYATFLKTHALRFWPVKKFSYLIFYVERETQVDIWRVLRAERDIPEWMGEGG